MKEQETNKIHLDFFSVKNILVIIAILAILAAGIWGYNLFRLKNIVFDGLTRYTETEFAEKLEGGFPATLTPFFCLTDIVSQKSIPFIEKYEIDYVDRQTARVRVHEKRVTGCVVIMGRYMFFDKDGIVVESSDAPVEGIPVISGLKFDEIVLYQKLKVQKQSLFNIILHLARLIELNSIEVREIAFDSNYEITLYLQDITVLLGKQTSYDEALNALDGILESISGRKGTLDMRNYTSENGEVILKEP